MLFLMRFNQTRFVLILTDCRFCESSCFCNNLMYKARKSNDNQLSYFGLIEEITS